MITITIDNYEKQKLIYTMPNTASIEIMTASEFYENKGLVRDGLRIDIYSKDGINFEKEALTK